MSVVLPAFVPLGIAPSGTLVPNFKLGVSWVRESEDQNVLFVNLNAGDVDESGCSFVEANKPSTSSIDDGTSYSGIGGELKTNIFVRYTEMANFGDNGAVCSTISSSVEAQCV